MQEGHGPLMLQGQCHELVGVLRNDCLEYKVFQIVESQKKDGSGAIPSQLDMIARLRACSLLARLQTALCVCLGRGAPVNRASRQPRGCCWIVYVCLSALASPSPMILPPVSVKELHRDTVRMVTELRLYIFQFCS